MDAKLWVEAYWVSLPPRAPRPVGEATWEIRRITPTDALLDPELLERKSAWAAFPKVAP
jgi:hypothetical protein